VPPDLEQRIGAPGAFPYTRGIHDSMYRGRLWTMRQYAGYGTAEETNARFRELLAAGQTGLSTAFDLPTQMGYDSDHPLAAGEVGRVGVAINTVDDLARVFEGIPLDRVTTSMTINATAAILLAMYLVVGEEQGVAAEKLGGTIQNDVLKEYIARGTYVFPPEASLRLATDVFRFVLERNLNFNPISISGYHMREAGATAAQELGFTFADALAYLRHAARTGLDVNRLAPRISFFFAAHNDLFEEVAKFRAARRLWATLLREEFRADEASCRLRFHTQTAGSTLTAQQSQVNVVRVAVQAMAAVLGGTQSLHTNAFDEALALPTADSARLALRTQQVLAHETGVAHTVDPFGGSYYVEALTAALEEQARSIIAEVERRGGALRAIAEGYVQREIAQSAWAAQQAVERGEEVVVGVNRFDDGSAVEAPRSPDYTALAAKQIEQLRSVRAGRDAARVDRSLARLGAAAAAPTAPLMEPILEAVKARATVGEIAATLVERWGRFGTSLTTSSHAG
ncbi:MAG TPA: methylmalonyl-CoA mutase family protein, partial [Gemmatimonadales bacterium]|nr:methylmalonyl-CoA mutase family protein [Gemmatimonadales bacterium]